MTLFGYSNTTKAIAKKVKNCKFYDDKFKTPTVDESGFEIYPMECYTPQCFESEIITPGIPFFHKTISKAKNLMSDLDYFAQKLPYSIWISGTNGKTTTTKMTQHLLKDKNAIYGGNVGIALADMDFSKNIFILEVSSFTLHYTNIAKPNIYILLPISPDHISWHQSFENYEEAKLKPIKTLQEGEIAIIPKKYENIETAGFKICYENSSDLIEYFNFDREKIDFKEPFLLDSILALAVSKILFDEVDYDLINSFELEPHKIEKFRDKKDRLWIDDSKATNTDASIQALKNYTDEKLFLILGGDDKGADIKPLFEIIKNLNIEIFAIGSNMEKIYNLSNRFNLKCYKSENLKNAVESIDKKHNLESIAILSPASASLDQFSSYIDRGEKFKKEVFSLR